MKKALSILLSLIIVVSSFSFSTISYSATKPSAESKLDQIMKLDGFRLGEDAAVIGNCYGFVSAVCEKLYGVKYSEGIYGNYRTKQSSGNYKTIALYEYKSAFPSDTTAQKKVGIAIRDFFINNAQPGDIVHYGAYTTGTSLNSTHTFMIYHIDREKMQIYHSNYETRVDSRNSCHVDTIVWDSFLKDQTKAVYNSNDTLYSHNNLFYNKMKTVGLGVTINRYVNYSTKFQMVDNSLPTTTAPSTTESTTDNTTTTQPLPKPAKVTELETTSIKPTTIGIRWKEVEDADSYYISIKNETKGSTFSKTVDTTSTALNNLTEGNSYTIKVRAVNEAGNGVYSTPITVIAKSITGIVKNLAVTAMTTSTLSYKWDKVKGATKYYMVIKNVTKNSSYTKTVTENSTIIKGLTAGNIYSVKVKAYTTAGGWGTYSDDLVNPAKPNKVPALTLTSPKTKYLTLKWTAPKDKRSGYQVYISTDKTFKSNVTKAYVNKASTLTYSKSGFVKGKVYYAKVRAYVMINGKRYYGAFSPMKQIKCK